MCLKFSDMTAFVIYHTLQLYEGNCSTFSANLLSIHYMLQIMLELDLFYVCIN